jgi:hypothetical protein
MNHYIHAGGGRGVPPIRVQKIWSLKCKKTQKEDPTRFFTTPTIPLKEFEKTVLLCSESRLRKIWIKK